MKNIVVTGSLAFDYIMDFPGSYGEHILPDKIKTLSVSFLVQNLNKNFGGTAGNIAYSLALLDQPPTILASAGKKDFDEYLSHLKTISINTDRLNIVDNEFTATAYIMTDKNNCQIAGFYPGAMTHDEKLHLEKIDTQFVVAAPTIPQAMINFIATAKKKNIPFLFDPAQALPRLTKDHLLYGVDGAEIVIGNDYEIALILEKTGLSKKEILNKTKILITTLGPEGSVIEAKNQRMTVGIVKPTKIVDPTGAGDAYIAGFIAGYTRQLPLQICGQLGATAAVYAIEQYGTQNHRFTMEEFNDRYKRSFGEMRE